ncbi:glycosyltransferase family 2 protein [Desulforhopalus singaporensis]|uniref:Glycosyltransferase involved in cell wall bisynthesis n=1 Tax=Desulforhopalus singaporensis TaxID=91360 RepID=A0A1H0PXQ1_9BACT|nr:glycosyltransferase [Desulforhopalus singaporensis]SDP09902.1 Glycosyltransferase involved in cell wall bisynthesis [Desulforhopalus singaporensis]
MKPDSPLISVIIPAYNHEKFIGEAVESVLRQTIADLELIVIDDGSTDNTGKVVKSYSDRRLSYYHQENQDAYNTINRGLSMVRGKYVAILNSDDVYTRDRFEKIVAYQKKTGAQCVITDVIPISDDGQIFQDPDFGWNRWHSGNRKCYFESGDIYAAFLNGNFMVTTSNLFMTAEAAEKVGKFCSLRYLHDYDYIFRMMLAYPESVHYMADDKLLYYRIHPGNTLGEAAIIGREQDQQLIRKYMAAKVGQQDRLYAETGGQRLIDLGNELHDVRSQLEPAVMPGVRPALKTLIMSLRAWLAKKLPS